MKIKKARKTKKYPPDACEGIISLLQSLGLSRNASPHQRRVTIQNTAAKESAEVLPVYGVIIKPCMGGLDRVLTMTKNESNFYLLGES